MACETLNAAMIAAGKTKAQRAEDVRKSVKKLSSLIVSGQVKIKIGKNGGIAFEGWTNAERDGVTDACAFRRIMTGDNVLAKLAIERAELKAGVNLNKRAIAHGLHSHDGGNTWHDGH